MNRSRALALAGSVVAGLAVALSIAAAPRLVPRGVKLRGPSSVGAWSAVMPWPLVAINTSVLPDGRVLVYPRNKNAQARVWNPRTDTFSAAVITRTDLFCSGHAFLADGRLLVAGGHVENGVGLADTNLFDARTGTWSEGPPMNAGRWYPTVTSLASGDALVVSGSIDNAVGLNRLPQVWSTAASGWRDLTGAQIGLPLYPFMHLAPDGRVFAAGPQQTTRLLDVHAKGAWTVVGNSTFGFRDYGSSVLYDEGKVLLVGGHDPPTNRAEVIDLNADTPAWRAVAPMQHPRRQCNAVILPDGKVLVVGGTSAEGFNNATGSVMEAELWDPASEAWRSLASAAEHRLYHSTAVLLPDGRVLTAGGGQPFADPEPGDHLTAEIYSPPYLFKGKRPAILSAPTTVHYGTRFFVHTVASGISDVTWVRLPSTTHAFDMNQRFNRLSFSPEGDGVLVWAPSSPTACPPGHYMLFVLNARGVPSEAAIVQIVADPSRVPARPGPIVAKATSSTTIELRWEDADWIESGFRLERAGEIGWSVVARIRADDNTFTDTLRSAGTTYRYRVSAYNAAGSSILSDPIAVTTPK